MSIEKIQVNGKIYDIRDVEDVKKEETRALAAEAELVKRLQGTSNDSDSRKDPFKFIGENTDEGYAYNTFNAMLDGLLYDDSVVGSNAGYFRTRVQWREVEIQNIVLAIATQTIVQIVKGAIQVSNNAIAAYDNGYKILYRKRSNGSWGEWKEYAGTSSGGGGTVDDVIVAQVNENTTNIARNKSDIDKLMAKNFPISVSLSVSKSVANILAPNGAYTFSWSIEKGNDKVTPSELNLTVNGNAIEGVSTNDTSYTYTYNSNNSLSPSLSASLVVKIDGITYSDSASVNFVYPSHIGVVDGDFDVNDADTEKVKNAIRGLSMDISSSRGRTYTVPIAKAPQKVVYAYPKSFGALSSIKDGNNLDMFNDFTCEEKNVYGNINHYVYTLNNATTNKGTVTIKFT